MLDPEKVRQMYNADLASDSWTAATYTVAAAKEKSFGGGEVWVGLPVVGLKYGLEASWLPCHADGGALQVANSADALQQLVEENHAPWPACPVHDHHSLAALVVKGKAVWQCQLDNSISYAIGCLPHSE